MARMIPRTPSTKTVSKAERFLFRRFAEAQSDWTVIHSLGLDFHESKPWTEADFVVVGNRGILVCEVKGGLISRTERQWYTNESKLKESPYDQAKTGSAALRGSLLKRVPAISTGIVGWCVMFPDCSFTVDAPDINLNVTYDATDSRQSIDDWIDSTFRWWESHLSEKLRRDHFPGFSSKTRADVVECLAGDFACKPSLLTEVAEVDDELIRLTEKQASAVAGLRQNPRAVIVGGAGTGKTLIAKREAESLAASGSEVLYVTHSKALAHQSAADFAGRGGIKAIHFIALADELIRTAGLNENLDRARATDDPTVLFSQTYPQLALDAWLSLADPPTFDAVVIDEAQDLLSSPVFELLNVLVKGEMREGTWRLFMDPNQDIFGQPSETIGELVGDAHAPVFVLQENCRNTAEIAAQTAIFSQRRMEDTVAVWGPDVELLAYDDHNEHV